MCLAGINTHTYTHIQCLTAILLEKRVSFEFEARSFYKPDALLKPDQQHQTQSTVMDKHCYFTDLQQQVAWSSSKASKEIFEGCCNGIFKPPPPVGAVGGYVFSGRPSVPLSVRP